MRETGGNQTVEFRDELMRPLRREIEFEEFHRDESLACRIVGAKHRPQRARPDLMKNAKRSEGVRRGSASSVSVQ